MISNVLTSLSGDAYVCTPSYSGRGNCKSLHFCNHAVAQFFIGSLFTCHSEAATNHWQHIAEQCNEYPHWQHNNKGLEAETFVADQLVSGSLSIYKLQHPTTLKPEYSDTFSVKNSSERWYHFRDPTALLIKTSCVTCKFATTRQVLQLLNSLALSADQLTAITDEFSLPCQLGHKIEAIAEALITQKIILLADNNMQTLKTKTLLSPLIDIPISAIAHGHKQQSASTQRSMKKVVSAHKDI